MIDKLTVDEIRKLLKAIAEGYKVPGIVYDVVKQVCINEIEEKGKVVLIKRDPNTDRDRIQAMFVKVIDGQGIEIYPPVISSYSGDFDGDSCLIYLDLWKKVNVIYEHFRIHIKDFLNYFNCTFKSENKKEDEKIITNYTVNDDVYTKSVNIENGKISFNKITEFSIHKNLEMYNIERRKSNSVITDVKEFIISQDHSIVAFDNKSETLIRTTPKDILEDQKRYYLIRDKTKLFNTINISDYFENIKIENEKDFGYFIGSWFGDGSLISLDRERFNSYISFSNSIDCIGNKWSTILEQCTNKKTNTIECDVEKRFKKINGEYAKLAKHWRQYNRELGNELFTYFSKGAANKNLPYWFCDTSEDFLIGFIAGYLETDGTQSGKYISFTSKSYELINSLNYILKYRFNIDSSIGKNKVNYSIDNYGYKTPLPPGEFREYSLLNIRCKPEYKEFFDKVLEEMVNDEKKIQIRKSFENLSGQTSISKKLKYIPSCLKDDITSDEISSTYNFSKIDVKYQISKNNYTQKDIPISEELIQKIDSPVLQELMRKQERDEIEFIPCSCLDITPSEETVGYDFTVENDYTFTNDIGIFVYDSMNVYVPISEEAQKEAREKLIVNTKNDSLHSSKYELSKEMLSGLFTLTYEEGKNSPKELKSFEDVFKHEINTIVNYKYNNKPIKTTAGRVIFNNILPNYIEFINEPIDKKYVKKILSYTLERDENDYIHVMDSMMQLGFQYSTSHPKSISMDMLDIKHPTLLKLKKKLGEAKTVEEQSNILKDMDSEIMNYLKDYAPDLYNWTKSGGAKDPTQLRQMMVSKGLIQDANGNLLPPISGSISDGYDAKTYFNASAGARNSLISKALGTASGGYLFRKVLFVLGNVEADRTLKNCGTKLTLDIKLTKDIFSRLRGRYVAIGNDIKPVSEDMIGKIIKLRSPVFCRSKGICRTCFGDLINQIKSDNVGIVAAQSAFSMAESFMKSVDSLIQTEKGLVSMEYLWNNEFKDIETKKDGLLETKYLDSFKIKGKDGFVNVYCMQKHPPMKEMLYVKTVSGHSVFCQEDHPMIVNRNDTIITVEAKDILLHIDKIYIDNEFLLNTSNYHKDKDFIINIIDNIYHGKEVYAHLPYDCLDYSKDTIKLMFDYIKEKYGGYPIRSFYLIFQLHLLANKIGLHLYDHIIEYYSKFQQAIIFNFGDFTKEKQDIFKGYYSVNESIKINGWQNYVYDLKTESCEFMAGCVQTHNSFHTGGVANLSLLDIQKELLSNISDDFEDKVRRYTKQDGAVLFNNTEPSSIIINPDIFQGKYKIKEKDDSYILPIGQFLLKLHDLDIPVTMEQEIIIFKSDNVVIDPITKNIVITYDNGDKLFQIGLTQLDYSEVTSKVDELISGNIPYVNIPSLYMSFFKTLSPTGGWDSVHIEVAISNILRNRANPQIPARLKTPFDPVTFSIKTLPAIMSWQLGLAFENMSKGLQYGLISDRIEESKIEKVMMGVPLSHGS